MSWNILVNNRTADETQLARLILSHYPMIATVLGGCNRIMNGTSMMGLAILLLCFEFLDQILVAFTQMFQRKLDILGQFMAWIFL